MSPLVSVFACFAVTVSAAAATPPSTPPIPKPPIPAVPPAAPADPAVPAVPDSTDPNQTLPRILVFTKTMAFRHASIPPAVAAIRKMGKDFVAVDTTENAAAFTTDNLAKYKAVVFLSTTGDVLNDEQQKAFEAYVRGGGGYAGVHAAADTEYDWPWYGRLVGAYFNDHSAVQKATVKVEDRGHRSTKMLPEKWERSDEWYSFRTNPRAVTKVLATLDETTYTPGKLSMGDHPIAWYHDFEGGRAWYTAGGHSADAFADPLFMAHVRGGIAWAAGLPDDPPPGTPAPKSDGKKTAAAGATGGTGLLASAPPILAAFPTSITLAVVMVVAAVVLGSMGQGVRAPVLAWVFPGLGHISLGYKRRGLLAMVGVLGMFITGLAVGGVDAVDSREDAPWFIAQAGNGPMAFGIDVVNQGLLKTGKVGELIPAPPDGKTTISSYKGLGAANEFGTLFIALGGLMNLVLMMDCARREPTANPAE